MNNEIGRKITSLTLMTIMVAGGLTFAVPGVMPAAHAANANLFVSAENSQFDNYMSGPQVIEVVVIDSDINDTDEAKGEPDVTINGQILRMVQAVDGNWYGYFADKSQAQIADSTVTNDGEGLDFGEFVGKSTNLGASGKTVTFGDTVGVAIPDKADCAGVDGLGTIDSGATTCANAGSTGTAVSATTENEMNVVREAKSPNTTKPGDAGVGQIGIDGDFWPIIQLYDFTVSGNVVVQYNKGGGVQTTTLTFDTVENFANISLDRTVYPQSAQVHATITDLWLNIDPTDEDSWTFGTLSTAKSTNYQVFDENGNAVGDTDGNTDDNLLTATKLSDLMCEDNCILIINDDAQNSGTEVLTVQDNGDSAIELTTGKTDTNDGLNFQTAADNLAGDFPVTITEQGPNSGVFGTYDESDVSALKITSDAKRGTSASIDYNETPTTILVGFGFATVDIQTNDDEWNSGEEIPVIIVDSDANKNSRSDEDLDLNKVSVDLIPALSTGDPFTIGEVGTGSSAKAEFVFVDIENDAAADPSGGTALPGYAIASQQDTTTKVQAFSHRAIVTSDETTAVDSVFIDYKTTVSDFEDTFKGATSFNGFNLLNIDVRSLSTTGTWNAFLLIDNDAIINEEDGVSDGADVLNTEKTGDTTVVALTTGLSSQDLHVFSSSEESTIQTALDAASDTDFVGLVLLNSVAAGFTPSSDGEVIVVDFFSFGFTDDGVQSTERVANQIVRIEAEETGDNTSTFEGSLEYVMVNQLNILTEATYSGLSPIANDPSFIVIEDLTDEDAVRVSYNDRGADGVVTPVSDQEEAPSHSGIVSFNQDSYKTADTVVITLEDLDLNVDSDLIDIFTVVTSTADTTYDTVGKTGLTTDLSFGDLGRLLDITFDDVRWSTPTGAGDVTGDNSDDCEKEFSDANISDTGLGATGFTLVETGIATGVFIGDFQIPSKWCRVTDADPSSGGSPYKWKGDLETTTGLDIEVNYVDFRDASGEIVEVGDSAGVRANTGSVSLDRTVYPVPFGTSGDFTSSASTPSGRSLFPIHATGIGTNNIGSGFEIPSGDLTIHVRVNDPDFDINPAGEDTINEAADANGDGPVKISVIRGSNTVVLGTAGSAAVNGKIATTALSSTVEDAIRVFGPITEIAPDAGIFELDVTVKFTDGPASPLCPNNPTYALLGTDETETATGNTEDRFDVSDTYDGEDFCILQGDILQVEYTDPADASGSSNTVTDSATFDLRNGVLQSDKSVYIIGSDMILTLIEPDFDLDNDSAETYDLDLIEWDSDAATTTMGNKGVTGAAAAFDPEPDAFRETGDSTGIFQIVIEIPEELNGDKLERGEEIILEYTDWGPSGSDYVGEEDEDVNLTIYTSNFGATVELDQKVYTWTDKVYITIVAPDHNFDSDLIDEIGETSSDPIKVSTRGFDIDRYKLVETGTDTGIFTGEVILTGFKHDADGDGTEEGPFASTSADGTGPTDGFIETDDDDGLTISFEFSEDETIVGSALIRWNIGEVQWLEASYPASGTGVIRVIDPDMNFNPEAVDNFNVDVWSDSDAGGIDLTVTETNEATGIFEGTVFFTTLDESSGHRLRVSEGDTVTAEYEDNTLPDPYTTADELDITATSLIGTVVPPLERAPAANLRTVDAFGNSLDSVSVDQQVQISADLANGQDREQSFAYLVQIQDANGVTVSLAWITGSLSSGQSFSPALSWIPTASGTYTATAFVWESVDNPTALSPPVSTTVNVS
ncbi:hypothetical protein [Nitrosopumilus piranensis]|uniref:Uncharacterized protein n=1 Tax=Nitrosopumilus piranensis TaxID=1582439 RepID=A0A0C5BSY5_9ARCH|nr:hypothetical protein [Nitrosopumilus piranensis]AJM91244.1 conserved exported protein of unknown function [Nitrosopumilus piranensis]